METERKEKRRQDQRPAGRRRWALRVVLAAVVLVLALLIGVSNYLVSYAIGRSGGGGNRTVSLDVQESTTAQRTIAAAKREQERMDRAFLKRIPAQDVSLTSVDGLKLSGKVYAQETGHRWALVLHGYRGSADTALPYAQHFYDAGYSVLTPSLRGCGESEGRYIGMGWLDREDVLSWIDWIVDRDPQAQIVVDGTSMGGATTMMVSGERTPSNVKAFVEDCGYTSVYDIFASELRLRFHLPEFPVMPTASLTAKLRAGYSFSEASALEQVKKCRKAMLFIHGTEDDFVPFSMEDILYRAKPGKNKEKIVVRGAGHGESMYLLGEKYWDRVFAFCDRYLDEQ